MSKIGTDSELPAHDGGKTLHEITRDKEYEMIAGRVGETWAANHHGIRLFIQTFSAVLGGSILLHNQGAVSPYYTYGSDLVITGLVVICLTILWDNWGTWKEWRLRLEKITQDAAFIEIRYNDDGFWNKFGNKGVEIVSTIIMLGALLSFWFFNPFNVGPDSGSGAGKLPRVNASNLVSREISTP